MPFSAFDHQLGNRQGPFPVNEADHQGNAFLSDLAAIDHKHQFANGRLVRQQFAHERQVKALVFNSFILHPATVAFDATVGFGTIRCFASDGVQLATASLHNPGYHCSQRGQSPGKLPLGSVGNSRFIASLMVRYTRRLSIGIRLFFLAGK